MKSHNACEEWFVAKNFVSSGDWVYGSESDRCCNLQGFDVADGIITEVINNLSSLRDVVVA